MIVMISFARIGFFLISITMNFCFFIGILDINEEKYGYQASRQGEITMFYPSLAPKMSSSLSKLTNFKTSLFLVVQNFSKTASLY